MGDEGDEFPNGKERAGFIRGFLFADLRSGGQVQSIEVHKYEVWESEPWFLFRLIYLLT